MNGRELQVLVSRRVPPGHWFFVRPELAARIAGFWQDRGGTQYCPPLTTTPRSTPMERTTGSGTDTPPDRDTRETSGPTNGCEVDGGLIRGRAASRGDTLRSSRFGFGDALTRLQIGQRVARDSWSLSGRFLELQRPDGESKMVEPYIYIETRSTRGPWLPTNEDLLANDWCLVTEDRVLRYAGSPFMESRSGGGQTLMSTDLSAKTAR